MTKTIFVTDFTEIHHIKIACEKCGFAVILPVGTGDIKIIGCRCGVQFPIEKIKTWLESTKELQDVITTNTAFADAVIEIETEEKPKT